MTPTTIFFIGVFPVVLIIVFLVVSVRELRRGDRWETERIAEGARLPPPPQPGSAGPMRVLVATDGSPCSVRAIDSVAARPWPADSEIEVATIVYTRLPLVPDVFLGGAAAHVAALEEDRQRAPERLRAAAARLSGMKGVRVSSTILEGTPAEAITEEAARFKADLVVVGTHGYRAGRRLLAGSVSQAVALHAPCSVEIVRCPEETRSAA
jgi:nucleotide-binding universal stress UspA family protein